MSDGRIWKVEGTFSTILLSEDELPSAGKHRKHCGEKIKAHPDGFFESQTMIFKSPAKQAMVVDWDMSMNRYSFRARIGGAI